MKFSVIINNYNYGHYVGAAISSALAQREVEHEVLVVDDGSTDASREVIQSYGESIRLVFKDNGGQASAFNAGFAAARGDWILFLDADDLLDARASADVLAAIQAQSSVPDLVEFRLRCIDESGRELVPPRCQPKRLDAPPLRPKLMKRGSCWFSPTSGMLFSRKLLNQLLPMPEEPFRICADLYLQIGASFCGQVVVLNNKVLGCYRVHGHNNFHRNGTAPADLDELWAREIRLEDLKHETIRYFSRRVGARPPRSFPGASPGVLYKRLYVELRRNQGVTALVWRNLARQVQGVFRIQHPNAIRARLRMLWLSFASMAQAIEELPAYASKRMGT